MNRQTQRIYKVLRQRNMLLKKGKEYQLASKNRSRKYIYIYISVKSITRDYDLQFPLFSVMLRKVKVGENTQSGTDDSKEHDIKNIFNEFTDIFPKKIPKGLPLEQHHDFYIDLKRGSTTQKKGLYQISSRELAELKSKLTKIVD